MANHIDRINEHGEIEQSKLDSFFMTDKYMENLQRIAAGFKEEILASVEMSRRECCVEIPISIFNNDKLSALETISKYLIENIGLRYCDVANLTNRNDRTIWGAFNRANKKMKGCFLGGGDNGLRIPISVLQDRSLSVLESIIKYLHEELNLRYFRIALLINSDQRTVWTVYRRVIKKKVRKKNNAKKK